MVCINQKNAFDILCFIENRPLLPKKVFLQFLNEWKTLQEKRRRGESYPPQVEVNNEIALYHHYYIITDNGEINLWRGFVDSDVVQRAKKKDMGINYD